MNDQLLREGWKARGRELNEFYDTISDALDDLGIISSRDPLVDLRNIIGRVNDWQDAGVSAYLDFRNLCEAKTLPSQAQAITNLSNSMSDLASWLPGFDIETGTIAAERSQE